MPVGQRRCLEFWKLQSLPDRFRSGWVVRRYEVHCRVQSEPFPTGIRLTCRGSSKQSYQWEVDAPSQLCCTDCIVVIALLRLGKAARLTLTGPLRGVEGFRRRAGETPLSDLPDTLVNDQGRLVAAEAGIDYRTMPACYEFQRVYRPMRRDLEEYRDADADSNEQGDGAGDVAEVVASLEQRVAALVKENLALREPVEEQSLLVVHWRTSRLQLLTRSRQCQC